jgi:hypothetical protein
VGGSPVDWTVGVTLLVSWEAQAASAKAAGKAIKARRISRRVSCLDSLFSIGFTSPELIVADRT